MALTDKLTAIADSIRAKTGSTGLMSLDEMPEMIDAMSLEDETTTYILVDENGNEVPAVLTEEEVELTATPNDIRIGTTAVTDTGVTVGEKEIPAYCVTEGARLIPAGDAFSIRIPKGRHRYTKLQVLFCVFNSDLSDSVATDRVAIANSVYSVNSTEVIAAIAANDDTESIELGLSNDANDPYVIRYFTYKEEY